MGRAAVVVLFALAACLLAVAMGASAGIRARDATKCSQQLTRNDCDNFEQDDGVCHWCASDKAQACYNNSIYTKLPKEFSCDHVCMVQPNKTACFSETEGGQPCYWCVSAAVPSSCSNATDAKTLPPGVFDCKHA
eukprot:m.482512 g.482512  ORF g.482512 m.482512 type:complete len:135 (+) comp22558_c0_seq1:118-522(+)